MSKGLRITRRFTEAGKGPYEGIEWSRRDSRITNPDGSTVFEMTDAEIPASWSQVASDIMVSKYFRKAGVPQYDEEGNRILDEAGEPVLGPERSAKQVFDRLAGTWRHWGEKEGFFASTEDAEAFQDELKYMLANQMAAPNSPQWFNTGLNWAYELTGPAQGFWYVDGKTGEMTASPDSYGRPAPHACFPEGTRIITSGGYKAIEKVEPDDRVLTHQGRFRRVRETMQREVDEDLITLTIGNQVLTATQNHPVLVLRNRQQTWVPAGEVLLGESVFTMPNRESAQPFGIAAPVIEIERRRFYGTVYNFQVEEDESYVANGVVVHNCFILSVKDDLVNPGGIMDLWVREARIFKFGSGAGSNFSDVRASNEKLSGGGKSSGVMSFLKIGDAAAGAIRSGGTTRRAAKMVILDVDHPDIEAFINWKKAEEEKAKILIQQGGFPADFNGEAYATVSGQNSNNSVRVSNDFIQTVIDDGDWDLINRTDGTVRKTVKARDLWSQIAEAAWACADPGVQFDTTINEWHTSPAGGRIRASNPCFTGEMRVATDKGLIQFKSLVKRVAEGESFQVFTHDATNPEIHSESIDLTTPTQVMVTGTNQILRLEFSDGRALRCTANHRLWTANRGWVRADELSDADQVRLLDQEIDFGMASWQIPASADPAVYRQRASSRKYAVNLPEKWSEDFAHYLGWLIGDGSVTDKIAVTVYGSTEEQQTTMLLHRELLTEINGGFAVKPAKMGNGTYQLRIGRNAFRRFLKALGVSQERAGEKRVPWSIFESPKPIVAAFLRGLYDADGCVRYGDTTRYVGLASASKNLLRDVQQLLDTFGIHGSIYDIRQSSKSVFHYTTKDGESREYRGGPFSDLRVMGSDLERFFDSIGFGLANKDDILHQVLVETTRYKTRHWIRLKDRTEDGWETTYNLTEPKNHSYLTLGILTSNCSEYLFIDDTACNLASINLVRFYDDATNVFDIAGYQHAIRLWTVVLEISVAMAHFPSREIAQGSYDYRTLGLGYANLGSLLMRQGIAYDSDQGRAIAGALTSIMTGYAYATSAEIASVVGPFPRFAENRESMLRVIRNHRRAAYSESDYEDVSHKVVAIDPDLCPEDLLAVARTSWDLALSGGEQNGYRNAQASVIAPTGTIGLLMDCDTTGVEPDFALVKFKKLAGGGYFKIVNQSVAPALRHLGYTENEIQDIVTFIVGTSSLDSAPAINRETLAEKGLTNEDLDKVENVLPGVFELKHAFNVFTFGEQTLQRLGFGVDEYTAWDFNLLKALGFTAKEINEANDYICGRQTIEDSPHIKDEHLPVFDTANKNGKYGKRFIHHNGHIKMMAAAQPFISGAISKCVTGETLLTTEDGLVRIESLHRGERADSFRDEVMEVASLGGPTKTDAFYYGGKRPVRTITLRSGHRVTGTPNHRALVAGEAGLEWRYLADIQPGEYVATQYGADMWSNLPARFDSFTPTLRYGNQKTVKVPSEMTEDLAFLLGAIAAEGHVTRANWTVIVTNADEGVLRRIARIWRDEFDVEAPIRRPLHRCPSVQVSSKTIVEFLDFVGVGDGAANKRIPDAVLRSPRSMVLAFLSGLFLDGYVTTSGSAKMGITVASSRLMDDLQAVLTNLGVVHGRSTKVDSEAGNTYHEVYAAGSEGQALARLVPFAESAKQARAKELLGLDFSQSTADVIPGVTGRELYEMEHLAMVPGVELPEWLNQVLADGLHFSPVSEVEDAGELEVYDLSVPDTHAFVGNGIVNHNTINMPNEIRVEDIEEAYRLSWRLGLKAMAIYRDGSKAAQPLNSTSDEGEESDEEDAGITAAIEAEKAIHWGNLPAGISPTQAYARGMKPPRFLLPARRHGFNQEARIGGHKVFLRTGEYDDGTLGEIFIDLAKEGATLKGILSCFAIAVSKGLQYGVPLEEFVDTFTFQTFEPRGMVEGHPNIKMANSIIDYVFRALGVEYLRRDELAQIPPNREMELPEPARGMAVEAGVQLELEDAVAEDDVDALKTAAAFVDAPDPGAGNGNGARVPVKEKVAVVAVGSSQVVDSALAENMGDAPVCSNCGHMTIRNGSCYVCLTCGDTTGCS